MLIYNCKIYKKNIKVCLCTLGKNENLYIKEFVEYYKNFGVDKIFLYDNNDIDGESFEKVIKNYIDDSYVDILNYRGQLNPMYQIMNHCYQTNYIKFDWIIFYEIDEYIFLKNYTNIKKFLKEPKFNKCQVIYLNWILYTDNNLIYYDNRSLAERFVEKEYKVKLKNITNIRAGVKYILKGHIPRIKIQSVHKIYEKLNSCNGFGQKVTISQKSMSNPDYKYYYIKHYYCKSLEEFVNKINKGCAIFGQDINYKKIRIDKYFRYNKITSFKIKYIENKTGINLIEYKNHLLNKRKKKISLITI